MKRTWTRTFDLLCLALMVCISGLNAEGARAAELPGWSWMPTPEEQYTLCETAAKASRAVWQISSPRYGSRGTAFCFDGKRRLLATSAHCVVNVTEPIYATSPTGETQRVTRVWLHSSAPRTADERSWAVDVAVLQLAMSGPPPPGELPLLQEGRGSDIRSHAVALVGFPTFWSFHKPTRGRPNAPYWATGVIHEFVALTHPKRPMWGIWHTALAWPGNSGSPIIREDGTVLGIQKGIDLVSDPSAPDGYMAADAIHVDALWELLREQNIPTRLDSARDGRALPGNPRDRAKQPPHLPTSESRALLEEANGYRRAKRYTDALAIMDRLVEHNVYWWKSHAERSLTLLEAHRALHQGNSRAPRLTCQEYERRQWRDAAQAAALRPFDPFRHVRLGYAICAYAATYGNNREVLNCVQDFAKRQLKEKDVPPRTKAAFHGLLA